MQNAQLPCSLNQKLLLLHIGLAIAMLLLLLHLKHTLAYHRPSLTDCVASIFAWMIIVAHEMR